MKLTRRHVLQLGASLATLPLASRIASAQSPEPPRKPSMPPVQPLAERLALYADTLRFEDLDTSTIERVKAHLIDTLGCGIAAFEEDPVRVCRDVALAAGGGPSTVIGSGKRTTPDLAAFANGAAFRYHDLNDVYVGRTSGHPSDNISACLAVAEAERSSPAELVTAIALVYEVACRLIDAFDLSNRGWDNPVFSLPAVALAAGKLMKLPRPRLVQAVNIALNDHIAMGQTRTQTLSDWKGFADAEAARNAVFAAMLARGGLTGPAPIFEGNRGFFALVTGAADVDVGAFGRRGVPFRIHQCGLKAYPVVVYGQTTVVAAIALAREIGDLTRIASIEIATTRRGLQQAGSEPEKWAPETKETADHSLPYVAARAMFDGDLNLDSYAPDKLRDPRLLAFMRRITVKEEPAFDAAKTEVPPSRLSVTLDDGRKIVRQVDTMPGFAGQPMTPADLERKFRGNIGKRWTRERTDAVLQAIWTIDRAADLRQLFASLALPSAS